MTDASNALGVLRTEQNRSTRLMFVCLAVLALLGIAATAIGAAALFSFRDQAHHTEKVLTDKINRLEAQTKVNDSTERQMVAIITRLAAQVRSLGGNPGKITVETPPVTQPHPSQTTLTPSIVPHTAPPPSRTSPSTTTTVSVCTATIPFVNLCIGDSRG